MIKTIKTYIKKLQKKVNLKNISVFSLVILIIGFSLTVSVSARKNSWKRPNRTPQPTSVSTPTATATPTAQPTARPSTSPTSVPTATPTISPTTNPTSTPTQTTGSLTNVYITYYGWNDNDPPGTAIAYPKSEKSTSVHEGAGGVGTYADPVTVAANPNVYPAGTKFYIPYIKKYGLIEDTCASCKGKWIDIWAGGNGQNESKLIACEEALTRESEPVEINPTPGREVNTAPLFDSASAKCVF